MPECPKCHITTGMWERGFLCPNCHDIWTHDEVMLFKGYDIEVVVWAIEMMDKLMALHLLGPGENRVEFHDDFLMVERNALPF